MIKSYRDLTVYRDSYDLAIRVYKLASMIPEREQYEIGSQIRRAVTSIPMNIAEGYGRKESIAEFKRFLRMAAGSANEVEVLLDMLKDLGHIDENNHGELRRSYEKLGKQINRLIMTWKQNPTSDF